MLAAVAVCAGGCVFWFAFASAAASRSSYRPQPWIQRCRFGSVSVCCVSGVRWGSSVCLPATCVVASICAPCCGGPGGLQALLLAALPLPVPLSFQCGYWLRLPDQQFALLTAGSSCMHCSGLAPGCVLAALAFSCQLLQQPQPCLPTIYIVMAKAVLMCNGLVHCG